MFEFFKKRREQREVRQHELEMGRRAGRSLYEAVREYLDGRLPEVSTKLLDVFRQRLATIHNEPEHPPELVAKVEWDIFQKQINEFPTRMRQEVDANLREWMSVADDLHVREMIDHYVAKRIADASSALTQESLLLLAEAAAAAAPKKPVQEL